MFQTRATAISLAAVVAALALLTIAVSVDWSPLIELDHAVARWGYSSTHGHHGRTDVWLAIATYGQPILVRDAVLVVGAVLVVFRRFGVGALLVGVALMEAVVGPLSKGLLDRPRPSWSDPITLAGGTSYPSGHATAAAACASAAVLAICVLVGSTAWRRTLVSLAVLAAALISVGRVFLGVHYASDVVAGDLLGVAIALAGWLLVLCFRRPAEAGPPAAQRG